MDLALHNKRRLIYHYVKKTKRERCDIKSNFKLSNTGLNLEFSFSYTGFLAMVKEPSSLFLALPGMEIVRVIPFLKVFVLHIDSKLVVDF